MNLGHLYRALRLKATATQSEIKSAYYRLSQIYHPDKAKDSSNSVTRFRLINDAYRALMKALATTKDTQPEILYEKSARTVQSETRKFRFQLNRGRKIRPPVQETAPDPQLDQRIQKYRSLAFKK